MNFDLGPREPTPPPCERRGSTCNSGSCNNFPAQVVSCGVGEGGVQMRCNVFELQPYTCDCPDGLSGLQCETNINECATKPCKNDAFFCVDKVNDYACGCKPGFTGKNCEIRKTTCQEWAANTLNNNDCDFGYVPNMDAANSYVYPGTEPRFKEVCCKLDN